jgi:hypothetical protein
MGSDQHCAAAAAAKEEELIEWDELLWAIRRSVRYHSRRADFFGSSVKLLAAISMFAGFGTMASVIGDSKTLSMAFGIAVALFSSVSLAFGFAFKEQSHIDLKRKFADLEKSMVGTEYPDRKTLSEKTAERLTIEADEPSVVRTLDIICHNELVRAQGSGRLARIGWLRSLFCQIDLPWLKPELEEAALK